MTQILKQDLEALRSKRIELEMVCFEFSTSKDKNAYLTAWEEEKKAASDTTLFDKKIDGKV